MGTFGLETTMLAILAVGALTAEGSQWKETYKVEMVREGSWRKRWAAGATRRKVLSASRRDNIAAVVVRNLDSDEFPIKRKPIAEPTEYPKEQTPIYHMSGGPMEGARFRCFKGLSISPNGRYLYLGGADEFTYRRIYVDTNQGARFNCPKGYKRFGDRTGPDILYTWKERRENEHLFPWPNLSYDASCGTFLTSASSLGIYCLTPKKNSQGTSTEEATKP